MTGVDPATGGGVTIPRSGDGRALFNGAAGVSLRGVGKTLSPPAPGGNVGASRSGTAVSCAQTGSDPNNPIAKAAQTHHGAVSAGRRVAITRILVRACRAADCSRISVSRRDCRLKRFQTVSVP